MSPELDRHATDDASDAPGSPLDPPGVDLPDPDRGDVFAVGVGAATGAAAGAALGGPPGFVAGAAVGAVRGEVTKKVVEKVIEKREEGNDLEVGGSRRGDPASG